MIFLLKGKLWTDSSASSSSRNDIAATTVSMLIGRSRKNHLQHDDFCGQQLIAWAQQNELSAPSSILPISTQTVQAPADVEAFTLMADDPKHVLLLSHYERSQEQNLEEGTAGEHRDGTNSVSGNIQMQEIRSIRKLQKSSCNIAKGQPCVKKIFDTHGSYGNWVFLVWCVIVIFVDTWFLYIPMVNGDKKCIEFDNDLWIAASACRSVFDLFYIIDNVFRLHTGISKSSRKRSWLLFLSDVLFILPIPQVLLILAMIQRMRGTEFSFAVKFFLFQHVLRTIQIYRVYMKAQVPSRHAELALGFSFSYIQTSNVIGALWYFFAIKSESVCWKKACINHDGCGDGSFYCDDHLEDRKFLNGFCPTNNQNSTIFDFGIFSDAFQSGVVETKDFKRRLYYCFRWGVQSLSSFGQGLQTSTNPWENIFAICITACGVWLLVILVGKIQTYTKSGSILEGMRQKEKELEQWLPFRKLSQNLQQQIKYHLHSWDETRNFNIENLVYNLPEDLGRDIKSELCLELLKKVEEFGKWRKALLDDLCEFVKPVVFMENSYIVPEGGSIDKMVFVVQGNLLTYNSEGITAAPPNTDNYDCNICGEELVAWAQDACTRTDSSSSALPISTITIQALTKVEAFILMADDLKNVLLIKHNRAAPFIQAARFITIVMGAIKGTFLPSTRTAETSTQEQVPPTIRSKQLVETQIIAKEK
ncbi:cyclic nucleotide-gated ion channel 1 [Citrus sinensis]|uniref:Cyclic nucleotide-gated ion channel 1 n=1 Tax=Citrus sinensis TaxID=2711 RepID=A0ACB8HRH5_CITSI|nr:cyclic nucleotide-gated ion channel 1 [Citrus sinensis]